MRCLLAFLIVTLVAIASGCDNTVNILDAGPPVDGGGPSGELTLLSDETLTLGFGAEAEIAVRYTQSGAPALADVRFVLEGNANDSTIDALDVATDGDGMARTQVIAGSVASAFRVRVSAPRASPVFVNVSVGEGFGGLNVRAPYEGERAQPTRRVVEVYSQIECDPAGGYPTFPSRSQTLPIAEDTARWQALPAGLEYAIVARIEGPTGATLARGCVGGVTLVAEETTTVEVPLVDAVLTPDGSYDVTLRMRTAVPVEAALLGALGPSIPEPSAAAALYLDAVQAELRLRGEDEAANALSLERSSGLADAELAAELEQLGEGPFNALAGFALELEARLSAMRMSGPLTIATAEPTRIGAVWTSTRFEVGAVGPDHPPAMVLDLAALDIAPSPVIEVRRADAADTLELVSLELALPLGRLMRALIDAELEGLETPGEALVEGAGCAAVLDWVAAHAVGGACDSECAQAACVSVLSGVLAPFREALRLVDATRDTIALSGPLELTDGDGDLAPDTLEGYELSGQWGSDGAADGDVLEATLSGARRAD